MFIHHTHSVIKSHKFYEALRYNSAAPVRAPGLSQRGPAVRVRFWAVVFFFVLPLGARVTARPVNTFTLQIPQPMLRRIVRDSGRIFAGTVIDIQRTQDGPGVPITQVTFRIEEAIRGVRKGDQVQIKEWGGLWQSGERYRTGERVLLFLYPASKLGLTSPVAGTMGRWPVQSDEKRQAKPFGTQIQKSQLKTLAASLRRMARE